MAGSRELAWIRYLFVDPDHVRLSGDAPQRSEIERILQEHAVTPLDPDVDRELTRAVTEGAKRLLKAA